MSTPDDQTNADHRIPTLTNNVFKRDKYQQREKVFVPELQKQTLGRDSPGFAYSTTGSTIGNMQGVASGVRRSKAFSMGKSERKSPFEKPRVQKDINPAILKPYNFATDWNRQKHGAKFSKQTRDLNFSRNDAL